MPAASPFVAVNPNPTMIDFPGRLAALLFVGGCNMRCGYCHNAPLREIKETYSPQRIAEICRQFKDDWVEGVTLTGGEPTCFPEIEAWLHFFSRQFRWAIKLDTNGSNPERLEAWLPAVDYVAMDYKAPLRLYRRYTGFKNTAAVAASRDILIHSSVSGEFRFTYVPGWFTPDDLREMAEELKGASRLAVQAYTPRDSVLDPDLQAIARPGRAELETVAEHFRGYVEEVIIRG